MKNTFKTVIDAMIRNKQPIMVLDIYEEEECVGQIGLMLKGKKINGKFQVTLSTFTNGIDPESPFYKAWMEHASQPYVLRELAKGITWTIPDDENYDMRTMLDDYVNDRMRPYFENYWINNPTPIS